MFFYVTCCYSDVSSVLELAKIYYPVCDSLHSVALAHLLDHLGSSFMAFVVLCDIFIGNMYIIRQIPTERLQMTYFFIEIFLIIGIYLETCG